MSTCIVNHIFVVIRYYGEHYEQVISVLASSFDKAVAEEYIAEQQAEWQRHIDFETALHEHHKAWDAATPTFDEEPMLDWPRWGTGIPQSSITPEMRAERERIKAENEAINQRNSVKRQAREQLWIDEYRRYVDALDVPADDSAPTGSTYFAPLSFRIKEIEVRAKA